MELTVSWSIRYSILETLVMLETAKRQYEVGDAINPSRRRIEVNQHEQWLGRGEESQNHISDNDLGNDG